MKLTTQRLKKLIREELNKINEKIELPVGQDLKDQKSQNLEQIIRDFMDFAEFKEYQGDVAIYETKPWYEKNKNRFAGISHLKTFEDFLGMLDNKGLISVLDEIFRINEKGYKMAGFRDEDIEKKMNARRFYKYNKD